MKQTSILLLLISFRLICFSQEINRKFFLLGSSSETSGYYHKKLIVIKPKPILLLYRTDTCRINMIEKITGSKFYNYKRNGTDNLVRLKSLRYNWLLRSYYKIYRFPETTDYSKYWVYGINAKKVSQLDYNKQISYLFGTLLMHGSFENGICTIMMGNSNYKYLFLVDIIKSLNFEIIESCINYDKVPVIYMVRFIPDTKFKDYLSVRLTRCL